MSLRLHAVAASAAGITPSTLRRAPVRASSPRNSYWLKSCCGICPLAAKMPKAMAKSKRPPSFGRSAGARLTVMRLAGKSKLEFRMALRTLSLLSFTAVSGKPTIEKAGKPLDR